MTFLSFPVLQLQDLVLVVVHGHILNTVGMVACDLFFAM